MEDQALSPLEKKLHSAVLFSFYGELLSPSQREMACMYFEEDLSLSEIASQVSVSRQGVHDAVTRAARELQKLEDTIGLYARFRRTEEKLRACRALLRDIAPMEGSEDKLQAIARLIDGMLAEEEEGEHGGV